MNELAEETNDQLVSTIENLLLDTSAKASGLSLYQIVNHNHSILMEFFSQNIEEYIYFMVAQDVTTYFSARIKKIIENISRAYINRQEGLIAANSEPFDLKFKLKNGEEFWIDIKSIHDQKCRNEHTIRAINDKAEKNGTLYRIFIYDDDDSLFREDYLLKGDEFWTLIAGNEEARLEIFKLFNGAANKISISSIIKENQSRLLKEWRMQD